jgi:hypothetical protein
MTAMARLRTPWLLGLLAALLAAPLVRSPDRAETEPPPAPIPPAFGPYARNVETSLYDGEGIRLRVSAKSLAVVAPRVLGPFRLGVHRRLLARDVAVHVFQREGDGGGEALPAALRGDRLTPLVAKASARSVASFEARPLRIVRHRRAQSTLVLKARRCYSRAKLLVCRDGRLTLGDRSRSFRSASFDGQSWKIEERS